MKFRVVANSLTGPDGVFVRGGIVEMSDEDGAVAVAQGVVEPVAKDAAVDKGIPYGPGSIDHVIAARARVAAQERADAIAFLKGNQQIARMVIQILFDAKVISETGAALAALGL